MRMITLGHGTASEEELAGLIRRAGIAWLVDVRTVPKSRRHPQFWQEAMEHWVPERAGSVYRWEPALGGFRKSSADSPNVALRHPSFRAYADYMETPAFALALDELIVRAEAAQTAILCSETVWWRCHRRLISDAAVLTRGVAVEHLMHDGKLRPHVPTPGVRASGDGTLRYDVLFDAAGVQDEGGR
ncbi:MAG: DUF488 family protein [Candidatus Baltobacteraceae bacterium]